MQRGQPHIAVQAYLELARETRDPRIAQRATEVAWNARFTSAALEAAGIWLQADPGSAQARQIIAALLVNQAQLADAQPHLEKWLAADRDNIGAELSPAEHAARAPPGQGGGIQADAGAGAAVSRGARGAACGRAGGVECRGPAGVARRGARGAEAEARLGDRRAVRRAGAAAPLQRGGVALSWASTWRPSQGARCAAQLRAAAGQRQASTPRRASSSRCWSPSIPQNADVGMAVALLAMQANDYDAAETQLKRVLELNYKDPDVARFYLGQLNEERKRFDEALKWYSQRQPGRAVHQRPVALRRHPREAGQAAGSAQAPAGGDRREQPAARAADAGRGAAAARCERLPGSVRRARAGARRRCPTTRTCSTTTRWRRRR